jgi:hypothetical protein
VDVVTYRDELQMDKADRTEVGVVTYHDELQVDKADRTPRCFLLCCLNKLDQDLGIFFISYINLLHPLQFYRPDPLVVHHSR